MLFFEINAKLETFEIVFAEWVEKIRYGEKLQKIWGGGKHQSRRFLGQIYPKWENKRSKLAEISEKRHFSHNFEISAKKRGESKALPPDWTVLTHRPNSDPENVERQHKVKRTSFIVAAKDPGRFLV